MNIKFVLAGLFLFGTSITAFADKKPIKFGKVSNKELQMQVYDKDTSASAVVLCDFGTSDFIFNSKEGFKYRFQKTTRIKILKKEGYNQATLHFLVHKNYDKITNLNGITFNLNEGKTVKEKLKNNMIYKDEYNKYYNIISLSMPAIKEGSVIDIEFTILSDIFDIRDWFFQQDIPTIYSEYFVTIPEYFYYKQLEKGYFAIERKPVKTFVRKEDFSIKDRSFRPIFAPTNTHYLYGSFSFQENKYDFVAENVPAFHEEENMTSEKNYLSCIQFELGSVIFPNEPIKNYTTSWDAIARELLFDSDFGSQMNGGLFLNNEVDIINSTDSTDESKMNAAYEFIQNYMTWNNRNSIVSYHGIRKAFNEKTGNCADINLMLIALLRKLKFDANPVILSTREHGFIHPAQIILEQYNYVIASVKVGDKLILMDATDKFLPMGMLPERCLNEKGRMIIDGGGDWVSLQPNTLYKKAYQVNFTVDNLGMVKGNVAEKLEGYAALDKRNELQNYTNEEEYLKKLQENHPGMELTPDSITGKTNLNDPLTIYYNFESDKQAENAGNLLLINPYVDGEITQNPYKLEKRDYPVDYSYPYSIIYMVTVTYPEGFSPETLPTSGRFFMPENGASFVYSVQKNGNSIVLISKLDIKKVTFLPDEYQTLKLFYNKIIDTEKQQLVIKAN